MPQAMGVCFTGCRRLSKKVDLSQMDTILKIECAVLGLLAVPVGYVLFQFALISHLKGNSVRDVFKYLATRDIGNLHADLLDEEGNQLREKWRIKAPLLFGLFVYAVCIARGFI